MKRIICLTAFLLLASASAFADIPRPQPTKDPKPVKSLDATMTIRLDKRATVATLQIPKSQIKQLRAELEQMDGESDNTAAVATPDNFSRTQTIVSGTLLSLALVFGGMLFVRTGKASAKALIILAVLAGLGTAATFVYANVGPPPEARSITSRLFNDKVFTPYQFASGSIKIEAVDSGGVQLIVPVVPNEKAGE